MNFGARGKRKGNHPTHAEMSDQEYQKYCLEVTQRIISNKEDMEKEKNKVFSHTTT
jgi:uncharacterized short protein YbdD (DUF466 family)